MRVPLAAVVVFAALAGCADRAEVEALEAEPAAAAPCAQWTADYVKPLLCSNGVAILHPYSLEARRAGTEAWSHDVNFTLEKAVVAMQEPGPLASTEGAAESIALSPVNKDTVEVRLGHADTLGAYRAEWFVQDPAPCLCDENELRVIASGTGPAGMAFDFSVEGPGRYIVHVLVYRYDNGTLAAGTVFGLPVAVNGHWQVEGVVHPLRIQGNSPTNDAAQMADIFLLPGVYPDGTVVAQVNYRGEQGPQDGTEIDLGIYDYDNEPIRCSRSHAGDVPRAEILQAQEHVEAYGDETGPSPRVWVGAQTCLGASEWEYRNLGPVPYTLDVFVLYE